MDPDRLKLKEKVEQDIRKDMNKVPEDGGAEGAAGEVQVQAVAPEKPKQREVPMFLIYFQIFDNVTKKNIVEFEDFSTSKVKPSMVKAEAATTLNVIVATKQEKDTTLTKPSAFDNHNWMYQVTKKNWVMMRGLNSLLSQKVQAV